ncbi:MAG: hypothetical protein JF606_21970 [Burkholderiales bacterium]|jgi:hypothetical protein|nr:hypothetical protein [Burkholderiales bacterium]
MNLAASSLALAPAAARFVFVGLDANYHPAVEAQPIFPKIVEYHTDGPAFWSKYGVHHPFLLPEYSGDGRLYHRTFASIGFTPEHAHMVSFVELLHRPTVGRNVLTLTDLEPVHLQALNAAVLGESTRHIFIPAAVARLMRATGCFPWLPQTPTAADGPLRIWMQRSGKTAYAHLHFSAYGKFERQKRAELAAIGALVSRST